MEFPFNGHRFRVRSRGALSVAYSTDMKKQADRDVEPQGTTELGSLRRGVHILKILATAGTRGLVLTEVAARAGLPHPTAHRVLHQLLDQRLVARNDECRRYRLGPLAFELGIASSTMYDWRDICDRPMAELSAETRDTVYLVIRSGFDAVCVHRIEGSFPIRTLLLDVGSRRPLGVGAGGLALLAAVEDEERGNIIERVSPKVNAATGMTASILERACARTRQDGVAIVQDTISLGVRAVGQHFCDAMGQPVGALSVAALSHRMTRDRAKCIGEMLRDGCASVERHLQQQHQNGWQSGA